MLRIFLLILTFISFYCYGDIKYEIEKIENNKQLKLNNVIEPNFYELQDKNMVNLNDWNLVIFIQSTCKYCKEFDPIIKQVIKELKIDFYVFSFDGLSDGNFDTVLPATNEIVATFYRDLPVATPTTFLVNVNDLKTYPVSQGKMTKTDFENQINKTLKIAMENK